MSAPHHKAREIESRREPGGAPGPHALAQADPASDPFDALDDPEGDFATTPEPAAQADRRNTRRKLAAGWRGLKTAVRGDSSFFAHFYRGTLIVIAASLLGIN